MENRALVSTVKLERNELAFAKVIAGVSPFVLRRVFGSWILFISIISVIVSLAPDLSLQFVIMTFVVLLLFTVVIFYQSRISEGWPSIVFYENQIGVIQDPIQRQFLFVDLSLIENVEPILIPYGKKGVDILLKTALLSEEHKALLQQAIWPYDDRLRAMVYFKKRETVISVILSKLKDR